MSLGFMKKNTEKTQMIICTASPYVKGLGVELVSKLAVKYCFLKILLLFLSGTCQQILVWLRAQELIAVAFFTFTLRFWKKIIVPCNFKNNTTASVVCSF